MKKNEQKLSFYPLSSLSDIDFKIKEIGKVWRELNDISISYYGGAYRVDMIARKLYEREE